MRRTSKPVGSCELVSATQQVPSVSFKVSMAYGLRQGQIDHIKYIKIPMLPHPRATWSNTTESAIAAIFSGVWCIWGTLKLSLRRQNDPQALEGICQRTARPLSGRWCSPRLKGSDQWAASQPKVHESQTQRQCPRPPVVSWTCKWSLND